MLLFPLSLSIVLVAARVGVLAVVTLGALFIAVRVWTSLQHHSASVASATRNIPSKSPVLTVDRPILYSLPGGRSSRRMVPSLPRDVAQQPLLRLVSQNSEASSSAPGTIVLFPLEKVARDPHLAPAPSVTPIATHPASASPFRLERIK
jgi:hypothetical protein